MTPELEAISAESYRIFAPYTIGRTLAVCRCPCCMVEKIERELVSAPLSEITAAALAEYTNSAHGWDDDQIAREMRYFLPRYLELIASAQPPCHMGLDICLRRLGSAGWQQNWPQAEVDVLARFFDAFMRQSLSDLRLAHWPVGWRLEFSLADVLTMVATAGGDLPRVLAVWDHAPDPAAVIHMAALRHDVIIETARTYFYSAYLDQHRKAAEEIGQFLLRPEVNQRIEAAVFAVKDPRLQQILSDAL